MARSVLADAPFERTVFTWESPGEGFVLDPRGNPIPAPGVTVSLTAHFAPFKRPQLQVQPGADAVVMEGRGDLVEPREFPPGVSKGTTMTVQYGGKWWVAKLGTIIPNDLPLVKFGTYFEAELTPAEAPEPEPEPEDDP